MNGAGSEGLTSTARYELRAAEASDAPAVASLVQLAYRHYVERIGFPPRPMQDDYTEVIANSEVTVAEERGVVVGVIVLTVDDEGFCIDNVAVHPLHRGRGVGRLLMRFAEDQARRAGFDSIYLYTHERMTENHALYSRIGYEESDRRRHNGFSIVYMRKYLH